MECDRRLEGDEEVEDELEEEELDEDEICRSLPDDLVDSGGAIDETSPIRNDEVRY